VDRDPQPNRRRGIIPAKLHGAVEKSAGPGREFRAALTGCQVDRRLAQSDQCTAGLFRSAVAGPEQYGPFLCEPTQRDGQRRFPRLDGQAD